MCIVLVAQLCGTVCDPMDCSSPGSSVHGILQATILEWLPVPSLGINVYVYTQMCAKYNYVYIKKYMKSFPSHFPSNT